MTEAEFKKLTETGQYRALTAAEIRADKLQREVDKLRHLWNHWKGAILMVFECVPDDIYDEGMSRRIKRKV